MGDTRDHLTQVERLVHHVMVDDMSRSKIKAKNLQRQQEPSAQDLILIIDLTLGNISIVVTVGGKEDQARLTQHVRQEEQNTQRANPRPSLFRKELGRIKWQKPIVHLAQIAAEEFPKD